MTYIKILLICVCFTIMTGRSIGCTGGCSSTIPVNCTTCPDGGYNPGPDCMPEYSVPGNSVILNGAYCSGVQNNACNNKAQSCCLGNTAKMLVTTYCISTGTNTEYIVNLCCAHCS